jgi:hypothetical protein
MNKFEFVTTNSTPITKCKEDFVWLFYKYISYIKIKYHHWGLVLSHCSRYHVNTTIWTTTIYHHTMEWEKNPICNFFFFITHPPSTQEIGSPYKNPHVQVSTKTIVPPPPPNKHYYFPPFIIQLIVLIV